MNGIINPAYYKQSSGKQVIDLMIACYGYEATINFCILNAFKYRMRAGLKSNNIAEDINKAMWYENKADQLKKLNQQNQNDRSNNQTN